MADAAIDSSTIAIHIVNSALVRLGEKPIAALGDTTPTAKLCQELYPDVRGTLLSWQAWPFATLRQSLMRLSAVPPSDFQYYYALPTLPPLVRVIDIDLTSRGLDYQREVYVDPSEPRNQQAVIATDAATVTMRYIGRTSEGVWPDLFVSTMAVWLAATIAPSITGKASLRATLLEELFGSRSQAGMLDKLRDIVGYEDSPREMPMPTDYIAVRGRYAAGASHLYDW